MILAGNRESFEHQTSSSKVELSPYWLSPGNFCLSKRAEGDSQPKTLQVRRKVLSIIMVPKDCDVGVTLG